MDIVKYCIFVDPITKSECKVIRVMRPNKTIASKDTPETVKPDEEVIKFPFKFTNPIEVTEDAYNTFTDGTRSDLLKTYDKIVAKYLDKRNAPPIKLTNMTKQELETATAALHNKVKKDKKPK